MKMPRVGAKGFYNVGVTVDGETHIQESMKSEVIGHSELVEKGLIVSVTHADGTVQTFDPVAFTEVAEAGTWSREGAST